jgi:hypothetical protein
MVGAQNLNETNSKELKKAAKKYNTKTQVKMGWTKKKLFNAINGKEDVNILPATRAASTKRKFSKAKGANKTNPGGLKLKVGRGNDSKSWAPRSMTSQAAGGGAEGGGKGGGEKAYWGPDPPKRK